MHQHVKTAYDGQPECHVMHGHNGSHGESIPGHAHNGLAAWEPRSESATARLHIAAPALLAALKEVVATYGLKDAAARAAWRAALEAIRQAEGA